MGGVSCVLVCVIVIPLSAAAQLCGHGALEGKPAYNTNDGIHFDVEVERVGVEAPDILFVPNPQSGGLLLEFKDATRRRVVERVLAASGAQVRWADETHADKLISGRYIGSLDEIVSKLLSRSNYIVTHKNSAAEPQITDFIILGSSSHPPNLESKKSKGLANSTRTIGNGIPALNWQPKHVDDPVEALALREQRLQEHEELLRRAKLSGIEVNAEGASIVHKRRFRDRQRLLRLVRDAQPVGSTFGSTDLRRRRLDLRAQMLQRMSSE